MKKICQRFLACLLAFVFVSVPAYARESSSRLPRIPAFDNTITVSYGDKDYEIDVVLYNNSRARVFRDIEDAANEYFKQSTGNYTWYNFSEKDVNIYVYDGSKKLPSMFINYQAQWGTRNPIRTVYIRKGSVTEKNLIYAYTLATRSPYSFNYKGYSNQNTPFREALTAVVATGIADMYGEDYRYTATGTSIARELMYANSKDMVMMFLNPYHESNYCQKLMRNTNERTDYYRLLNDGIRHKDDLEDLIYLMSDCHLFSNL